MKHPNESDWMEFLYSEASPGAQSAFQQHLEECESCRQKTAGWRRTMGQLDSWRTEAPSSRKILPTWPGAWKWAAAACLVFTTAFAAGRFGSPSVDPDAIQARIAGPLQESIERRLEEKIARQAAAAAESAIAEARAELREHLEARIQEVAARSGAETLAAAEKRIEELALALAALRQEDQAALWAAVQELELSRLADNRSLRQELETVAVNTDQSLRQTQRRLVQLASHTQPEPNR